MTAKSNGILSDFGINSAVAISNAIEHATNSNWRFDHSLSEVGVSNSIILSCTLFSSIYLFSTSLTAVNKKILNDESQNKRLNITPYLILNSMIMGCSGGLLLLSAKKCIQYIY
jgi:hypothetical protein